MWPNDDIILYFISAGQLWVLEEKKGGGMGGGGGGSGNGGVPGSFKS